MSRFICEDVLIVVFEDGSWDYEEDADYDESRDCTMMSLAEGIELGHVDEFEVMEV